MNRFATCITKAVYCIVLGALCGLSTAAFAAVESRGYVIMTAGYNRGDFGEPDDTQYSKIDMEIGTLQKHYNAGINFGYVDSSIDGADSVSGASDALAYISTAFLDTRGYRIAANLSVKIPLADADKNLGTGKTDVGLFMSYSKKWQSQTLTLSGGYIDTGDTDSVTYRNVFLYGAGYSKRLTRSSVYVSLEGGQNSMEELDDPLELYAGFMRLLGTKQSIFLQAFTGLTDGSADYGIRSGMISRF